MLKSLNNKHLITIVSPAFIKNGTDINCRECAVSCQSACKTSCTVGNQECRNDRRN